MPLTIGVGSIISEEGYTLLMSPAAAGTVWKSILSHGALPMGSNAWERLRVLEGRFNSILKVGVHELRSYFFTPVLPKEEYL